MKLWTIAELAEAAGVSGQWIRRLCAQGEIKAQRKGLQWIIEDTEAQRYLESRRKGDGEK